MERDNRRILYSNGNGNVTPNGYNNYGVNRSYASDISPSNSFSFQDGLDLNGSFENVSNSPSYNPYSIVNNTSINVLSNERERPSNSHLDNIMRLWNACKSVDKDYSGILTAKEFREAIKLSGLQLGTKIMDKILSEMVHFTGDGKVDYTKMETVVDNLTPNGPIIDSSNSEGYGYEQSLPSRTHSTSLRAVEHNPDAEMKERQQKIKQIVQNNNNRIHSVFIRFEKDQIRKEVLINFLQELGLDISPQVLKVLKRKEEVGSCSFTQLIHALVNSPRIKNEANPESPHLVAKRLSIQNTKPMTSSLVPPEDKNKTRLIVPLPPSLKDSDVLNWSVDPKKQTLNRKGTPNVISSNVTVVPSKFAMERLESDDGEGDELRSLKQEKINALIRDFIDGFINPTQFRTSLKELGIELTYEIERMINGHERDGTLSFNEFYKVLHLNTKGEVQFVFDRRDIPKEQVNSGINLFPSRDTNPQPIMMPPKSPQHKTLQSSVKLNWENIPEEPSPSGRRIPTQERGSNLYFNDFEFDAIPSSSQNLINSKLLGETGNNNYDATSSTLLNGRPTTPGSRKNISTVGLVFNSEQPNYLQTQFQEYSYSPQRTMTPPVVKAVDIISWQPKPPPPTSTIRNSSLTVVDVDSLDDGNRKHFTGPVSPLQIRNPLAPFGTSRDQIHGVNPHHYKLGKKSSQ